MTEEKTFEEALGELEDAVSRLESGQMTLEQALDCFESGVESVNICRKKLRIVESRIDLLLKDSSGGFSTEDYNGEDKDA